MTAEAKALEHQIMAADSLTRKHSDSSDSMLLDFIDFDELPPVDTRSTILKRRASQFMVEGPLTPPILSDSPMKKLKTVSFTAELSIEIPPAKWVKKVGEEELTDYGSSHESEDLSMMETFHEQVTRMVENETLDAADTTGRVDVPELEFVYPVAPWDEYSRRTGSKRRSGGSEIEAQMQFIKRVKLDDLRSAAPWSGLSALERELRWNIFTSRITKITLDEKLHGETECEKMLGDAKLGQIATSSSQVWKREGLRLLDEDDEEDEELASADLEEQRDIESLIRKRKLELDEAMEEVQPKRTSSSLVQGRQGYTQIAELEVQSTNTKRSSQKNGYERKAYQANPASKPAMPIKSTGDDLMFGGFSATSALHKFMRTQGKAVQHINAASKDEYQTMTHPKNRNDTFTVRRKDPAPHILQAAASQSTTATPPSYTLPDLPNIPEHLLPAPFIISSAYLQRRSLIKQIERHYPSAELIYRDYTLSHSPSQEADMILSPSTGLIETTLQKIKQQPLPGQTDRSPDKLRMKQLHLRYERLVVLVSEGLIQEMEDHGTSRPTDSRDKEAIKMFRDLADSLEGEVLVEYVPGGEQALARTMVLQMAKYGLPRGSRDIGDVRLLDTETSVCLQTLSLSVR